MKYDLSQLLEAGVKATDLRLRFGAGRLNVNGRAPEGSLVTGTLEYDDEPPRYRYRLHGDEAEFDLEPGDRGWHMHRSVGVDWDVHLSRIPTYSFLRFDMGACHSELDLSTLDVREFEINTGASTLRLGLGDRAASARGSISVGAAEVSLWVPRTVGVRLELSGALSSTNLGGHGVLIGSRRWTSEGYETKEKRLDLRVQAGVSRFRLEWMD